MIKDALKILVPGIAQQLQIAFDKNRDFVDQVQTAIVTRVTFDQEANAGYIYVRAGRELNAVERNIIGVKHGHTMPVPGDMWIAIDLDNFERLTGIEILTPSSELEARLKQLADLYP